MRPLYLTFRLFKVFRIHCYVYDQFDAINSYQPLFSHSSVGNTLYSYVSSVYSMQNESRQSVFRSWFCLRFNKQGPFSVTMLIYACCCKALSTKLKPIYIFCFTQMRRKYRTITWIKWSKRLN